MSVITPVAVLEEEMSVIETRDVQVSNLLAGMEDLNEETEKCELV